MGCLKLKYYEPKKAPEVIAIFFGNALEKNDSELIFCLNAYTYGFNGMERDDEVKGSGNSYDFGARIYDSRIGRWMSTDAYEAKFPSYSPYNFALNNPIYFIDPDGNEVVPTTKLKANSSLSSILALASENSVYKDVMKAFISNQNNIYIHLAQLKDANGNPTGFMNTAWTEPSSLSTNPVSRYGFQRIVINSDILSSDGNSHSDKTFVFMAILHEGIHARMFERGDQSASFFDNYPGHKDFINRLGYEGHHSQMADYNRQELITGMKEFDSQLRDAGEVVPDYHTDEWYDAMSWYGLRGTQSWEDFNNNNPEQAGRVSELINQQVERTKKAIDNSGN